MNLNPIFIAISTLLSVSLAPIVGAEELPASATNITSRRELFVDDALVEKISGQARFQLHSPTRREIAIQYKEPWEGNASGYSTIIQDSDVYHMFYRGHKYIVDDKQLRQAQSEVTCYAHSSDGIHWIKPKLGLFDWRGSKENNIVFLGSPETHNFAPFIDANPNCPDDERFKAIGGTVTSKGLWTFKSADGIHWSRKSDKAVVTKGAFDSHNACFWDTKSNRYVMYVRYFSEGAFKGLRSIGVAFSTDFETWTDPVGITYPNSPPQQMYTNQVLPYYRASHILVGFPTRYVARKLNDHGKTLEPLALRDKLTIAYERCATDLTDGIFMASRNGQSFRRWDEAFLRPGPEAAGHWIYGDNYQAYGLWETKSNIEGAPNDISMHFSEHAWLNDLHRQRRYTIRLDGFVSLYAPLDGGELITKPIVFTGQQLHVNYSTSAAGSLYVELQDLDGQPLSGFTQQDSLEHYGDSTEQVIRWKSGPNVSTLTGKPIRIRFILKDGDLYSYQFGTTDVR
ncbi:MAG: hypothetical protein HOB73_08575 [Planctomycetaceae bacterium]|nr:hypothetical protein [Planctomycetaceae bacterium]